MSIFIFTSSFSSFHYLSLCLISSSSSCFLSYLYTQMWSVDCVISGSYFLAPIFIFTFRILIFITLLVISLYSNVKLCWLGYLLVLISWSLPSSIYLFQFYFFFTRILTSPVLLCLFLSLFLHLLFSHRRTKVTKATITLLSKNEF